jgi:hypothetical protein
MGRKFELRTNHSGMKYLFRHPTLNVIQTRWLEFLNEYDIDIKHIKGKENKVVDALNRRVHEMHATTISMYSSYLKDKNLEVVIADPYYVLYFLRFSVAIDLLKYFDLLLTFKNHILKIYL